MWVSLSVNTFTQSARCQVRSEQQRNEKSCPLLHGRQDEKGKDDDDGGGELRTGKFSSPARAMRELMNVRIAEFGLRQWR